MQGLWTHLWLLQQDGPLPVACRSRPQGNSDISRPRTVTANETFTVTTKAATEVAKLNGFHLSALQASAVGHMEFKGKGCRKWKEAQLLLSPMVNLSIQLDKTA